MPPMISGSQNSSASVVVAFAPSIWALSPANSGRAASALCSTGARGGRGGGTTSVSAGPTGRPSGRPSRRLSDARAVVMSRSFEMRLISNERDITTARASLNRLLGRPLGLPVGPADTLVVPPPLPPLAPVEQSALAARPELAGLKAQIDGAKATTTLAEEFWLPDIIGGIEWDLGAPDVAFPNRGPIYTYGLSVPIPIFFWQHTAGDIRNSRHHTRELEASYKDLVASIDQDVRLSYATAATALQQAIYLRDQLLPS